MLNLTITNQSSHPIPVRRLKTTLLKTLALLGIESCEWSITIVRDAAMKKLHAQTMNDPTTTDVLTFDLRDKLPRKPREGDAVELDTVLCRDEAARRAKDLGHSVADELLLYAVHSLLHVQGYDDTTPAKFKRMHAREDELLTHLAVGPLYTPHSDRGAR